MPFELLYFEALELTNVERTLLRAGAERAYLDKLATVEDFDFIDEFNTQVA